MRFIILNEVQDYCHPAIATIRSNASHYTQP